MRRLDHTDAPLFRGSMAGRYTVIEQLGADEVGVIELAHDSEHERKVVLKRLHAHLSADDETAARFITRAKEVAGLQVQGVCPVIDVGTDQEGPYFASAHQDAKSFLEVFKAFKAQSERAVDIACYIIAVAADILQTVHEKLDFFGASAELILIESSGAVQLRYGGANETDDPEANDLFALGVALWDAVQRDGGQEGELGQIVGKAMAWSKGPHFESPAALSGALHQYLLDKKAGLTPEELGELMGQLSFEASPVQPDKGENEHENEDEEGEDLGTLPVEPASAPGAGNSAGHAGGMPVGMMADRGATGVNRLPEGLSIKPQVEESEDDMDVTLLAGQVPMPAPVETNDTKLVLPPMPKPVERVQGKDIFTGGAHRAPAPAEPIERKESKPAPSNKRFWIMGGLFIFLALFVLVLANQLVG